VYNETRSGVCLHIDGRTFTPEELVAMVLTHAKDITNAFGVPGEVKDCVLTVPSFYTQHERRALLDAAALADLNVLALIDENTAAGLHYGIDRVEEEPRNILFYNMGASALQVSIMQFYSYERKESKYGKGKKVGAFQVLGKGWDASVGGEAFDARIVNFMADEFNEIWNKKRNDGKKEDVRKHPRAMAKLRVQANKIKQVLSANMDVPIFIDSLHDDVNYASHLTRATFEELCHDLLERSIVPITNALKAANMTLADIHGVELIGGGMRVPKVQANIQEALGDSLELGMHINSDESMALGAAFHGANVSTAFKVRHVGMTDINPFPVSVALGNLESEEKSGLFGKGKKKNSEEEEWSKEATIFKANGKIGIKKTIAFTHDQDVDCTVKYEPDEFLPEGTNEIIEKYNITGVEKFAKEMEAKGLGKPKVSLQFELSSSGIITLSKAEAAVEETYTITEEVEVDDEESSTDESKEGEKSDAKSEEKKDADVPDEKTDDTEEKKEEHQKKKTISVEKVSFCVLNFCL
jgi:hypoxia up-regulated 1